MKKDIENSMKIWNHEKFSRWEKNLSGNVEIVDIFTKEVLLQKDALPVIIHKLTLKLLLSTTKNNCKQEKACNKNSGFFRI